MKRFVGKGSRNAMLIGAILGVIFCAVAASAPVVYGITIGVGTIYCLLEEHFLERDGRVLGRRRRR
jgi:hypothetical protein